MVRGFGDRTLSRLRGSSRRDAYTALRDVLWHWPGCHFLSAVPPPTGRPALARRGGTAGATFVGRPHDCEGRYAASTLPVSARVGRSPRASLALPSFFARYVGPRPHGRELLV